MSAANNNAEIFTGFLLEVLERTKYPDS